MNPPNTFCSRCGTRFAPEAVRPKGCLSCGGVAYENPVPVAVVLVPVEGGGLLLEERGIPPFVGGLALPGGFMERGESWRRSGSREVLEETGIAIDTDAVRPFHGPGGEELFTTPNGDLLVFMEAAPVPLSALDAFVPCGEVPSIVVAREPRELCFPAHTAAMAAWFARGG